MKIILKGIILTIFSSEIVSQGFEKRPFRIREIGATKPNVWELECQQGDCNLLDKFKILDEVACQVEIRGRLWEAKGKSIVFTTLKCTDIARTDAPPKVTPSLRQQQGGSAAKTEEWKKPNFEVEF